MFVYDTTQLLLILGNLTAAIIAFWQFFLKEKYKSQLQKQNYIHEVQFEKEFSVYNDLWARIVDVCASIVVLKPREGTDLDNEAFRKEYYALIGKAQEAMMDFRDVFFKNKPFYSEEIFKSGSELIAEAYDCLWKFTLQAELGGEWNRDALKIRNEQINNVARLADDICNNIRDKIGIRHASLKNKPSQKSKR